jgi:hypothetical protein
MASSDTPDGSVAHMTETHATHRWSGWPGAWCLDCGIADPTEQAIADGHGFDADGKPIPLPPEYRPGPCPEPGSNRHNPYGRKVCT